MSANNVNDQSFVKTVLAVIGVLVLLSLVIAVAAAFMGNHDDANDPVVMQKTQERLQPIGHEVTDPEELKKMTAVAPHAPMNGEQVVTQVCSVCHGSGVLGAPKIGDKAAWGARKSAAGGVDGLASSAMKGKNSMPPRGGRADLTDDEVKAAVEQMLKMTGA